jgi:DNA repair exonuclease SbcCD nuclease subunit
MKIKNLILNLAAIVATVSCGQVTISTNHTAEWKDLEKPLNFYLANDLGRNGYYDQKPIAETMGKMAETIDIEFVLAAGDVHHFEGVQSVSDPLWMTNYELIYSHPDLMMQWFPICGNHEYRSNTDAVVEYSNVSARWEMPDKYYTFVKEEDGVTVRIVMLDTTPMIDKYREDTEKYADASKSDWKVQIAWLDKVLSEADEDWVLVVGHHPVFAYTDKNESERTDLQQRLDPVLRRYGNVDMYLCGHIHTFQHIRKEGCDIDYVVNTSGSMSRKDVQPVDGTVFCSNRSGWSLITADEKELNLHMLDKDGKVLHTVTRNR